MCRQDYTLSQWAAIYYSEVLTVPIELVGAHLAIPQVVNTIGVFAVAGLENALLARGQTVLGVRKLGKFTSNLQLLVIDRAVAGR